MTNTLSLYMIVLILAIIFIIIERLPSIIISWSLVGKAGQPAWSQLIPIYATIVRAKIAGSMGVAIGFMLGEVIGVVLVLVAVLISFTNQHFGQTQTMLVIGVVFIIVGNILGFMLGIKFGAKFVIVNGNGAVGTPFRWRASLFTLFNLKYIQYGASSAVPTDAPKMVGYDKADYVPVGFDKLAIVAGWVGAFSFPLLIPAPIALILGIVATTRIHQHPERKGRGRAWFATIWGLLWSLALIFIIYYIATHSHANS